MLGGVYDDNNDNNIDNSNDKELEFMDGAR